MTIGILGGSGFLGTHLTKYLLEHTNWQIRVISHSSKPFDVQPDQASRVTFVIADVLDEASLSDALQEIDTVYYFVHMMGQKNGNFYELETKAAETCKRVVNNSAVSRLIYMGGLGNDKDKLSKHLASRHKTGHILRSARINVIEFRASMVIGQGSVAFDIITNLVDKLPVMILPQSASTLTQPIIMHDALTYLYQAAIISIDRDEIVEIGGPVVLSYAQIYKMYAQMIIERRLVVRVPFVPAWLEAKFLDHFTPEVHACIGKAMVESLGNEMVVTSPRARELFPDIKPEPIERGMIKLL